MDDDQKKLLDSLDAAEQYEFVERVNIAEFDGGADPVTAWLLAVEELVWSASQ